MIPDWSQLPEELLHLISKKLEDYCFDVIHARSVRRLWRSTFPFPSYLLRTRKSLPTFRSKDLCTLEKFPLFLFRVRDPVTAALLYEYFLGRIGRDDGMEQRPSPLQCSVKVEIPGSVLTFMNVLDTQIILLGYHYRMMGWKPEGWMGYYRGVVFLPLNEDGEGREFVVLLRCSKALLVLTSAEMRWKRLENIPDSSCENLVTFRGRIYATFLNGDIFVFDPYSLQGTRLMPAQPLRSIDYLVPCGNDELFLIEKFNPNPEADLLDFGRFTCRVSRLDEKAGQWVVVSDLGDRVLFIGDFQSVCCSAKELPDGCGMTGNSILFTNGGGYVTFLYKYGVCTRWAEDELNIWRFSREKRVGFLNTCPVVALWLECET